MFESYAGQVHGYKPLPEKPRPERRKRLTRRFIIKGRDTIYLKFFRTAGLDRYKAFA